MIWSILIAVVILGYGAWVLIRKAKRQRKRWKEGCTGNCCGCCGCGYTCKRRKK